jgi:hypothetical protein
MRERNSEGARLAYLCISVLCAGALWIASLADAAAQRRFDPNNPNMNRRNCTFQKCFDRCISTGGIPTAGGRLEIGCSRRCSRRCPR